MGKVYGIFHEWETDGGYGDAVYRCDLIGVVNDEETAKAYVKKYKNPHIYDMPYDDLEAGDLTYMELESLTLDVSPASLGYSDRFDRSDPHYHSWVKRDDIPVEKARKEQDSWRWQEKSPNFGFVRVRGREETGYEVWIDEAHYREE